MLGGQVSAEGVSFARQVIPVPAKRIPRALRSLIDYYKAERLPGESFRTWTLRTSDEAVIDRLREFIECAPEAADLFIDWGDQETYSLKLGRGECAV